MQVDHATDHFDHPLYDALWSGFDTCAYQAFKESVTYWLWTGCTGGFVFGPSRAGKTSALERIVHDIEWRDGRQPVTFSIAIGEDDIVTVTEIWRDLCRNIGMRVKSSMSSTDLRNNFYDYLLEQCFQRELNQVIIFVDEVQRLSMKQLGAFVRLYDNMRKLKVRVLCVLVGNEDESTGLLDQTKRDIYAHKRGRFFTQFHHFNGIQSKEELTRCLTQYDTLRFPQDGPCFTEYFLPRAYGQQWRMASLAPLIWQQFRFYKKNRRIPSLGMQYFRHIVDTLLMDRLPHIDPFLVDSQIIEDSFADSGLIASTVKEA
jgi:AAA domain